MIPRDLDVFARTIFGEARGEAFYGQVAVAWVIMNRYLRNTTRWGRSIADVCLKPWQFSCWNKNDPNYARILAVGFDDPAYQRAFGISCLVLRGDLLDPTGGADHYHTVGTPAGAKVWPPTWAKEMTLTARVGRHQFLKE